MAVRDANDFTYWAIGDVGLIFDSHSGVSLVNGGGRFGNNCLRFTSTGHAEKIYDAQATWIYNQPFRVSSIGAEVIIMQIKDGATVHLDVRVTAAGALAVTRNGTSLGTGGTIVANTWYGLELKVTIHDSTGVVHAKLDGVSAINLTGQDTRNGGNATADRIRIMSDVSINVDFSDQIIMDATGSVNNDFIGDKRLQRGTATGAGNSSQFTPSAGSNYQNVDETAGDGDTTYNESSTVGHRDDYAFSDLAGSGAIAGVVLKAMARKTDAGARSIQLSTRIGSTNYDGSNEALASSYTWRTKVWDDSPATSIPWTVAEFNGAQFGAEVTV